jgi:hypothetical protein
MALRPRLSPGLPLSLQMARKTNGPGGIQARTKHKKHTVFGGLAIMAASAALDPWLCVPDFRRVCHYRTGIQLLVHCLHYKALFFVFSLYYILVSSQTC